MNKHPGMGPMQVRDYIRRHMGQNMGVNSIRRIMEQNGWVPPYVRKSRIKDSTRHFEAVRKNFLWHTDFKHHYINQCRVAILFFQDDYSRFLVGHSFSDSENIETVTQTLEDAIAINGKPEAIDCVSVVAIASQIQAMTGTSTIASLAAKYSVPLMSEHRNRAELIDRLQPKSQQASSPDLASLQNELRTARALIAMLLGKSQGVSGNNIRKSYAPWLKQYLASLLESGTAYKIITNLTDISEETLRHFRADHLTTVVKEPASDDHQFIKEAWNKAPARCRNTLDSFWTYLGHCHSHYKISLEQVRTILAELGLRYPRGKKSKNAGTNVKYHCQWHASHVLLVCLL